MTYGAVEMDHCADWPSHISNTLIQRNNLPRFFRTKRGNSAIPRVFSHALAVPCKHLVFRLKFGSQKG
jgi:hypothetical protein